MNDNAEAIEFTAEGREVYALETSETSETVGVSEQQFNQSIRSLESLLIVQVISNGFIFGCLVSIAVVRWFHVR